VVQGEWPVGLLLDEVWLVTRRTLVAALERAALWPRATEHQVFTASQRKRGEALREQVLLALLSEEDGRWLMSPSLFGASNRRFRARTPLTLAFGYSVSEGLQSMTADVPATTALAEACGLFNFGISIFDLLHDTQPQLVSEFTSHFNRDVLARLQSDESGPAALRQSACTSEQPEIRLLLQTIAGVYERLHDAAGGPRSAAFAPVATLLARAYEAEMRSAACTSTTQADRLAISHAKSTLPFAIIGAVSALGRGSAARADHQALVDDIGMIFWLTDDLVDVVGDARSRALNSLLVRAAGEDTLDIGPNLTRLLESQLITDAVRTIGEALQRVSAALTGSAPDRAERLDRVVAAYVRTWIE
jgi:hypothetical protein